MNIAYDEHALLAPSDLLGVNGGVAGCQAVIQQTYQCNGKTIGTFTITKTMTHGTANNLPATIVTIQKSEAGGMMRSFLWVIVFVFYCVLHSPGGAMRNPADLLRENGIGLDHASLVRALTDPRPFIRSSAASVIGEEKDLAALPDIEIAAKIEEKSTVLFSMLATAQMLGSPDAESRLALLCVGEDTGITTMTANYLQSLGNNACINNMIPFLATEDATLRESSLLYLTHVKKRPNGVISELDTDLLAIVRTGDDAHNVQLAGQIIMQIGDERTKALYKKMQAH